MIEINGRIFCFLKQKVKPISEKNSRSGASMMKRKKGAKSNTICAKKIDEGGVSLTILY